MSKFVHYSKQFFEYFDMFPATQFLRYKGSGDFKTATGGCVSVAVIVIFVILFYSLGVQTVNQQIIFGSVSYINEVQPQPLTFRFTKGSDFMFAVGIQFLNLGDTTKKYFNISLRQHHYGPLLSGNNFTNIPLIPCTPDHFSYNTDILDFYYKFYLNTALCPPLDYDFVIGGRVVSNLYSEFSVYIDHCNQGIDPSCASDAQVMALQTQFQGFTVYTPIISTIVNPGDSIYKQVYVEQRNYYFFTTTSGLWLNGQIQQLQIDTDISLLPMTNTETEYITTIPNLFQMKPKEVYNGEYVHIVFSKSGTSTTFTRSFNKIDSYLSYVGGLVGTMLLFFFIFSSYSEAAFNVSIASQLYKFEDKGQSPWKKYNFFYFLATTVKGMLSSLKIQPQWDQSTTFMDIIQQMEKQLSIQFLIKRINYLEEAISAILTDPQKEALYLNHKVTIQEAAVKRKKANVPLDALSKERSNFTGHRDNIFQQNDVNKESFIQFRHHKQQSNLQIMSEQNQTENWPSSQKDERQEIVNNIRQSLAHVISESKSGNPISCRIIDKIRKTYPENEFIYPQTYEEKKVQRHNSLDKEKGEKDLKGKLGFIEFQQID